MKLFKISIPRLAISEMHGGWLLAAGCWLLAAGRMNDGPAVW